MTMSPIPAAPVSAMSPLKQWFRIDECAEIFAVSPNQIRNWMQTGDLDGRSVVNAFANSKRCTRERLHVRITRDSIVRLLNDQKRRVV